MMAAFAELERDIIHERTMAGLRAARAQGRVGGRPTSRVVNRTIPDMINFCPRSTPNNARRALENVLQSLGCSASTGRPVLIQPPPWARRPYPRANGSVVQTGLRGGRMGNLPRA